MLRKLLVSSLTLALVVIGSGIAQASPIWR